MTNNYFSRRPRQRRKKASKKRTRTPRDKSSSSSSSPQSISDGDNSTASSSTNASEERRRKRRKKRKNAPKKKDKRSHDGYSSVDSPHSSPERPIFNIEDPEEKERTRVDNLFKMLNRMWPYEDRPRYLQKKRTVGLYTIKELMGFKRDLLEEAGKRNLGEEVFSRDSKPTKSKYKAMTDDGRRKLHPARWNRQPLVHPDRFYHKIPKKRDAVIRNFPTEHLGITGQVIN
jgi:hypothetical protein